MPITLTKIHTKTYLNQDKTIRYQDIYQSA